MASYGIGPARIVAAAVEQFADEHGISGRARWPPSPCIWWCSASPDARARRRRCPLSTLTGGGVEVLYDDRDAGPGEKFADAELLGCPLRLTVGRRSLESARRGAGSSRPA